MEELLAVLLEVIESSDLIADSALLISEDAILSELAFDMSILEDVYAEIVESLDIFKKWMMKTFELTNDIVNAMLTLQLIYNMVYSHYQKVSDSGMCISVEVALDDIEGTLKKNYKKMIALAQKEVSSTKFKNLPESIQNKILEIEHQSPMQYWLGAKTEIMTSLKKIPFYNN